MDWGHSLPHTQATCSTVPLAYAESQSHITLTNCLCPDLLPSDLSRLLMDPCPVRQALGRFFKFECVVGMNGTVWINTRTVVHTIAIASAFTSSEYMSGEQCNTMVEKIIDTL